MWSEAVVPAASTTHLPSRHPWSTHNCCLGLGVFLVSFSALLLLLLGVGGGPWSQNHNRHVSVISWPVRRHRQRQRQVSLCRRSECMVLRRLLVRILSSFLCGYCPAPSWQQNFPGFFWVPGCGTSNDTGPAVRMIHPRQSNRLGGTEVRRPGREGTVESVRRPAGMGG